MNKLWIKLFAFLFLLFTPNSQLLTPNSYAIYDPTSVPNNHFGIHIISPTPDEASPAAALVNTNGDWGYITLLVESKDRDVNKWQQVFNDLRRRHLIPLVRLATGPEGSYWKKPYQGEEEAWADFLDRLNWPAKNRYVIIYNEPNAASEWGNNINPEEYAQVLNKTIDALKKKSADFYLLNAGFDSQAPHKPPNYFDQAAFMHKMNETVPGIFNKLDGWVCHCYPNPGFKGSPDDKGRGTIIGWEWEMGVLRSLGVSKNFPVFITETGWKHREGLQSDLSLPTSETVSLYFKQAYLSVWSSPKVIAVTPFLLNYQEAPFDHFSFKKITGIGQSKRLVGGKEVLSAQYPDYYPQFQAIKDLPKIKGEPIQENKAKLLSGEVYKTMVEGEAYQMELVFENIGQSIWGEKNLTLKPVKNELGGLVLASIDRLTEPGGKYSFKLSVQAKKPGKYKTSLQLYHGETRFNSAPFEFETEVKEPVELNIQAGLRWKKNFKGLPAGRQGDYQVVIKGVKGKTLESPSQHFEARYLLPDYIYDITIKKPFYKPKTLRQTLTSGENQLDFGTLEPDLLKAIFKPVELWKLLPWSD